MIESLSTTGTYEDVILRGFPKEGPPYKSLYIPFDNPTWMFILCAIIMVSLTLLVIENAWSTMRKEESLKTDGSISSTV